MSAPSSSQTCLKCGRQVPPGAGFCPHCGTAIVAEAVTNLPPAAVTGLGDNPNSPTTIGTPTRSSEARTISPTGIVTSLDSPSPRPAVRAGDGPFQAGQQIGPRYTILKLLGTGGMGAVYQAFDHELGVAVAIKVIRPSAQADATAAKELELRFKRELVLARQVTHKYVVRIHDLGEIEGIKYLTMPFVEGETLAQILRKTQTLPLDRVIKIAQQVAQGLAAAHEKGVVHRDLKPENIMIEKAAEDPIPNSGDALIMDFGIARSMEHGATQTAAGSVIGTLEYMAPEQAQGLKVDQRADQYAFGLIMYDMLIGRSKRITHENPMTELLARLAAAPPAPRTLNPAIPESVNDIVMKCLQLSPDARYASTQELATALDHLNLDGSLRSDVHEVIIHDGPGRPKWQLAAAGLLIVALGGAAGFVFSRGSTSVSASHDPVSVLIGDIENKTGNPLLDGVVEQALSLGIEGASFINSFPRRDAVRSATAAKIGPKLDEVTAKLVAFREGVGLVIVGSIEKEGSGFQINIKGVGPGADGQVRFTLESDAASPEVVLQTVATLAGQVRSELGDTVTPTPADAFTAANLDAVRAYAKGQELFANGNLAEAIPAYIEATKHDPDFGRGFSSAATAAANLGRREEADKYYKEALNKSERMTDREKFRTRGQYYLFLRNSADAVKQFTELLARYPSDAPAMSNLANAHFQLRQFDQARAIGKQNADLYPKNPLRQNNVALYAMYAGKFDEAAAKGKVASDLNKEYALAYVSQGLANAALGKYEEAIAAYKELATKAGWEARAAIGLADLALLRGRINEAAAALEPVLTAKAQPLQMARVHTTLAGVRIAQNRMPDAIKLAESALGLSQDPTIVFEAGRILLAGGRNDRVKVLIAQLGESLSPEAQAYGLTLNGESQLVSSRNARAAVPLFQQALKQADQWQTHYLLGRAYLELGEAVLAEGEFDTCIQRQGQATAVYLDDVPTWRLIAPVHYFQGLARVAMKNTDGAATALKTFVELKSGGDEQGSMVTDARKRLAQ